MKQLILYLSIRTATPEIEKAFAHLRSHLLANFDHFFEVYISLILRENKQFTLKDVSEIFRALNLDHPINEAKFNEQYIFNRLPTKEFQQAITIPRLLARYCFK